MEETLSTTAFANSSFWSEASAIFLFQGGYNATVVMVGTTLLGVAAGIVGCFALLRRRALMADALAHAALPGLAGAFLLASFFGVAGKSLPLLLGGAAVSGVLGILVVHCIVHQTRLAEDAAIGAVLSVFFGAGIVGLSVIQSLPGGAGGGLHHFIYGQAAAMQAGDAWLTAVLAGGAIFAALLLVKEFRLLCFDDDFAAIQGWPVGVLDLFMMTLVVCVTIVGFQSVGILLVVALLIIPPAGARFWTERFSAMLLISAVLGGLSAYFGAGMSALLPHFPAGAVIVLIAALLFLFSLLFAPARGLLARWYKQACFQLRVKREHVLRSLYEYQEQGEGGLSASFSRERIVRLAGDKVFGRLHLLWLSFLGFLRPGSEGRWELTEKGGAIAARLTRNHRLWELFVLEQGSVHAGDVDYSADFIEHVLSEEIVRKLEERLVTQGQLREPLGELPSVHPVTEEVE